MNDDMMNEEIIVTEIDPIPDHINFYPRCEAPGCNKEASFVICSSETYHAKQYVVSIDGEFADGKRCKTFRSCDEHVEYGKKNIQNSE